MFSKAKYFLLTFVVLIGFASSTYAEGDTYCTGRVTGVTSLQNVNAGQISFNSHEGPGLEDNESVDLSIIGQAGGLAPASREYAACVDDATGTYAGDAYEYALHGFSWNDNLGFISYGCQDGKNRAGEGTGIACGDVDYGVHIDSADELFGHAYSSAFGWMQFRGQGEISAEGGGGGAGVDTKSLNYTVQNAFPPAPAQTASATIGVGESMNVVLQGQEHVVTLNWTAIFAAAKAASVTVDGTSFNIIQGGTRNFVDFTFVAENITASVINPLLGTITFRLREYPEPVGGVNGPNNIAIGETQSVTVDGVSYEISLQNISGGDASTVSIDGFTQNVNEGVTQLFSSLNFTANTVITIPGNAYGPLSVDGTTYGDFDVVGVTVDGLTTDYKVEVSEVSLEDGSVKVKVTNQNSFAVLGNQWISIGAIGNFGPISILPIDSNYTEGPGPHLVYYFIPPDGGTIVEECADGLCGVGGEFFDYGVTMDADGYLHGYAWTEAGIWVDFEGARIELPDQEVSDGDGANWCEGKPYICLEVSPNPVTLEFDAGGGQEIRIADGSDGYYVHLFLMDETGDNPLVSYNPYSRIAALPNDQRSLAFTLIELTIPPAAVTNFLNSIQINWQDTVKIDQTNRAAGDVGDALSTVEGFNAAIVKQPWANTQGAVTYKPLTFADFDLKEPGHYISKFKVSSFAPTDDANLSWTTSTDPKYLVSNTEGRGEVEPNQLILKNVTYNALSLGDLQLPAGAVFPNGKVDLNLPFRPAIEVSTLYSGVLRDTLMAYRSVPENVAISMKSIGALPAYALNVAKATFTLSYSTEETQAETNCAGANFDFHFLKSFAGFDLTNANPSKKSLIGTFSALKDTLKDIPVIATLPVVLGEDPEAVLPCNYAKAPTLYSKVRYKITDTSPLVLYYHNDLPRISGSGVFNPEITVHGNIVGQKITGVANGDQLQSSGSGIVSVVRDTINENVEKYIEREDTDSGSDCVITDLAADFYTETGCSENYFKIGYEQVLYFRDADVVLDLDGGYGGQWVIIADGGDIFVHGDAYNADPQDQRLSLLAFGNENFEHGNVYLGPCSDASKSVKNLQATIVADGALMSYDGNKADIGVDGRPTWASPAARVDALSCQLLLEGTIFAPGNTIGGADTDTGKNPRPFILLGGGEVKKLPASLQDRMKAQNDDLNYLRLFRLELEISPEGLPIDQRCGTGLSPADVLAIDQSQLGAGPVVCGEIQPCDASAAGITYTSPNVCNGINPFDPWTEDNYYGSGDLVPPQNQELLADRLYNAPGVDGDGDFDPVYVFYVAPDSDSFVFSKASGF